MSLSLAIHKCHATTSSTTAGGKMQLTSHLKPTMSINNVVDANTKKIRLWVLKESPVFATTSLSVEKV